MPDSQFVNRFSSNRKYFEPYGLACVYWQPTSMPRPDYHNEIELNFLLKGSVTYLFGGHKITLEAGKLAAFWAAIPHQVVEFSNDVVYFAATIPLHTFLQWRLPDPFVQPLLQGHLLQELSCNNSVTDASLFKGWERDLCGEAPELEEIVLLEMHARLRRLAVSHSGQPVASQRGNSHLAVPASELSSVEQMACYIMKNYADKITIQQVSDSVGLTPNYAMNLFRQTFGATIGDYLTQHRLSHAQRLLVTTTLPITNVALEAGFGSISRFNEVFSLSNGCSPRQYRKKYCIRQGKQ
ncbi:helix-turn-helix domain-containing protein [Gilvimarinus sp. SDUM040013]|uniref:Helix-turn-helix domain-containing protein n=1 Tax=Gilvimarinus gilvus TaxID=3058038 RepID=A0ABU4RV58_9GAMM|nr:helix-turn-helix domain-containing protein [Gilvimarinus sp. SDUM040013]MDO3387889.1 helix-turn-helix domain-containing protein [Gilvimarinus sp. SDUM040013]MDX6848740.1 helix-turn-helix domain-containing protein [Gilvimarinus sp. SDUM040013]